MTRKFRSTSLLSFGILLLFFLQIECKPLISVYDQYAYTQTTSLKVDAVNLIGKAAEKYSQHEPEINELNIKFQKAYEYEKNRPNNGITTSMWELIMNDKTLYGGFIQLWKDQQTVSPAAIAAAQKKVAENFDRISQLESKKAKP